MDAKEVEQRLADAVKCTDDPAYPMWIINLLRDALAVIEQQEQQILTKQYHIDDNGRLKRELERADDKCTQLEAQLRERDAACAAMREIAEDCLRQLQWVPDPDTSKGVHPCQTYKRNIERFNATDAGKALLERLRKAETEPKRMYPIQDGPSVPWEVMAPHEAMSQKNHSQSITRIAERGGFSCAEAWMVVNAIEYKGGETKETWAEYKRQWIAYTDRINTGQDRLQAVEKKLEQAVSLLRSSDEDAVSKFLETYENRSME